MRPDGFVRLEDFRRAASRDVGWTVQEANVLEVARNDRKQRFDVLIRGGNPFAIRARHAHSVDQFDATRAYGDPIPPGAVPEGAIAFHATRRVFVDGIIQEESCLAAGGKTAEQQSS